MEKNTQDSILVLDTWLQRMEMANAAIFEIFHSSVFLDQVGSSSVFADIAFFICFATGRDLEHSTAVPTFEFIFRVVNWLSEVTEHFGARETFSWRARR